MCTVNSCIQIIPIISITNTVSLKVQRHDWLIHMNIAKTEDILQIFESSRDKVLHKSKTLSNFRPKYYTNILQEIWEELSRPQLSCWTPQKTEEIMKFGIIECLFDDTNDGWTWKECVQFGNPHIPILATFTMSITLFNWVVFWVRLGICYVRC